MGESFPFVEFMLEIILKSMQDIQKSSQKILSLIASNPHITITVISENLGMSEAGVKFDKSPPPFFYSIFQCLRWSLMTLFFKNIIHRYLRHPMSIFLFLLLKSSF